MIKHINDDLIEINENVTIARGPRKLLAVATESLLSNEQTADHYQVGRIDAQGKPIVLGEPMHYLDWLGFQSGVSRWYVYKWNGDKFELVSDHHTQAEAVEAGLTI